MKGIYGFLIAIIVLLRPLPVAAENGAAFPSVEREHICAWMSLAAYDDHVGELSREELRLSGWQIAKINEENKKSAPQFYLAKKEQENGAPLYLVAITGTQSVKDVKNDLNFGKVLFGGSTKEEFQKFAETQNVTADQPQVHGGFHEYTQTAFFSHVREDMTMGEWLALRLQEEPQAKLCLTGHSLGGASAVLLAARLMAMGVPSEQIEVVSFGAPAVGNAAFCEQIKNMQHDRVIIAGDPVRGILQSLNAGYDVSGKLNLWRRNRNADIFRHSMTVYLDAAMRMYYEKYQEFPPAVKGEADIYAVIKTSLCSALENDKPYVERAIMHYLQRTEKGRVVFSSKPEARRREHLNAAAKAGCKYIAVMEITGRPIKDRRNVYTIELQETIFDEVGNLIGGFGAATSNKSMTPIEAALYNIVYARNERIRLLNGQEADEQK